MNKALNIMIFIIALLALPVHAQDALQNYVRTVTMLDADGSQSIQSVQYVNGLGYPSVGVATVGGNGETTYSLTTYDTLGRESRKYLPVAYSSGSFLYKTPDVIMSDSEGQVGYNDNAAFSLTRYDVLNRPVSVTTPGSAFASKPSVTEYTANTEEEVICYGVTGNSLTRVGYYPAGRLTREATNDADGKTVETFKDFAGRVIMQRVAGELCTYFVYDSLGQLRFVLPPKYQSEQDIDGLCYEYRYDRRGRVCYRRYPGAGHCELWYDNADRMTFFQDAEMRKAGKYRFYLYDQFGRNVIQGLCTERLQSDSIQKALFSRNEAGVLGTGYVIPSGHSAFLGNAELETVCYYDGNERYVCPDASMHRWITDILMPCHANDANQTGMLTAKLSSATDGEVVAQAMQYDLKGNLVKMRSREIGGIIVEEDCSYSFTGQVLSSDILTEISGDTLRIRRDYGYNPHIDKKNSYSFAVSHGNVSGSSSFSYVYDGLGRLSQTVRNGLPALVRHDVSNTYDMRGWLKSISTNSLVEELFYEDGPGEACYNGNISSIRWKDYTSGEWRGYRYSYDGAGRMTSGDYAEGDMLVDNEGRYSETLSYDDNGNITSIVRNGVIMAGHGDELFERADDAIISDDDLPVIEDSIPVRGRERDSRLQYGHMDNLSITYNGNQLQCVTETAMDNLHEGTLEYKDANGSQYIYNDNGALVADRSRGIAYITYDFSDNPVHIYFTNGSVTRYVYSSTGQKLRVVHYTAKPNITRTWGEIPEELTNAQVLFTDSTDYLLGGAVTLTNGRMDKCFFDGGYCQFTQSNNDFDSTAESLAIYYCNQDHLGNIREVVDADGNVAQVTNYYPFGTPYSDSSATLSPSLQEHKYNGKELDTMHGLNTYDYGARQNYSILGRWDRIDPLCEKYYHISPYAYCLNNPVIHYDPDGRVVETVWDAANVVMDVASCAKNIATGNYVSAAVDAGALIVDAAATILPGVPGGAGAALKVVRGGEKVVKATKNTYRRALQQATGKIGKGFEAHHTIPQKYRNYFEKIGINIDKPGNVVWRESKGHRKQSNGLTKQWDDFMQRHKGKPTKEQVYKFRDKMEKIYFGNKSDVPKN